MPDFIEQLVELSELRRRGSLSARQFETARTQLLQNVGRLPSAKEELEIELVALDQEWKTRREGFRVPSSIVWQIPTKNQGTRRATFTLVAGGFMTFMFIVAAVDQTRRGSNPGIWITPIFPPMIAAYAFFSFKDWDRVADDYERAETKYQDERAELEAKIRALQVR